MTKETSALKQSDEFEPDESCPEITMRRKLIAARQQEKSLATKAFSLVDVTCPQSLIQLLPSNVRYF